MPKPFGSPSMERRGKTNLTESPAVLFPVGVRSQSARARNTLQPLQRVTVQSSCPQVSALGTGTLCQRGVRPVPVRPSGLGILNEIEARSSSPRRREPPFYLGLVRPLLLLELRGGITYPW